MGIFVSVAADGGIEDILARKNGRGLDVKQTQTEEERGGSWAAFDIAVNN